MEVLHVDLMEESCARTCSSLTKMRRKVLSGEPEARVTHFRTQAGWSSFIKGLISAFSPGALLLL